VGSVTKKAIFVGGTAYCGSTLFCLTLANDPAGFATGEVHNLFHPSRPGHREYLNKCTCGGKPCLIWSEAKTRSKYEVYSRILTGSEGIDTVVDSSKNVFWIEEHSEVLRERDIDVKQVLMWKTPSQIAASFKKRGMERWLESWVNYHRLYFSVIPHSDVVIPYSAYTEAPIGTLKQVCSDLGVRYFLGKEEYWQREFHALGGNPSARIHLYDGGSTGFENARETLSRRGGEVSSGNHQKIYHSQVVDNDDELVRASKMGALILEYLRAGAPEDPMMLKKIRLPKASVAVRRIKQRLEWRK